MILNYGKTQATVAEKVYGSIFSHGVVTTGQYSRYGVK